MILPLAFLIVFYYFPLLIIFINHLALKDFFRLIFTTLSDEGVISSIIFSFWQALLSAVLSVLIGFPIAYIIAKYDFRGKNLATALMSTPFVLPTIVVSYAFIILYSDFGIITRLLRIIGINIVLGKGIIGILLAHIFYNSPLSALIIAGLWRRIGRETEEVSAVYSKSKVLNFFRITLPLLMPGILLAFILSFLFCFLSFEIVLILGGGYYRTIEVEIFTLYNALFKINEATALAFIQLILIALFLLIYLIISEKIPRGEKTEVMVEKSFSEEQKLKKILLIFYLIIYLAFQILPIVIIILSGFYNPVTGQFTMEGLTNLLSTKYNIYLGAPPIMAPINSLIYSASTAIIVTILSIISARVLYERRAISIGYGLLMFAPMATSRITLALSYILAFGKFGLLENPTFLIISLHILIAYPFATRIMINGYLRIEREIREASLVFGNPKLRLIKIELPLLKSSIIAALIISLATSLGEFAASNLLARGRYATLTIFLYLMIGGRRFVSAGAAAFLLTFITIILFYVIIRTGESLESAF